MSKSPEKLIEEQMGYLDGLIRFFAPYEYSKGVKDIIEQLKEVRLRAIDLGELITNDPENKGVRAQLKTLEGESVALTRQITKYVVEIEEKNDEIKRLQEELKKYQDKE